MAACQHPIIGIDSLNDLPVTVLKLDHLLILPHGRDGKSLSYFLSPLAQGMTQCYFPLNKGSISTILLPRHLFYALRGIISSRFPDRIGFEGLDIVFAKSLPAINPA